MQLILNQFLQLKPLCPKSKIQEYFDGFNSCLKEFEINTPLRISHFWGQVAQESLKLKYFEELASGDAYNNRKDLGNTLMEAIKTAAMYGMKPGPFWKGHGAIQITGFYNHKECGKFLKLDLINYPKLLTTPQHGTRAAGWYWNTGQLNLLADLDDIKAITKKVNGGYNHLDRRIEYYNQAKLILGI